MPQVDKGAAKRSAVITTRFTEAQKKELEATYGKAARGVHAIVVASLKEKNK